MSALHKFTPHVVLVLSFLAGTAFSFAADKNAVPDSSRPGVRKKKTAVSAAQADDKLTEVYCSPILFPFPATAYIPISIML